MGKPPLYEPDEVPKRLDLGSSNPRLTPAREWLWHGHPTMTIPTIPNMHKSTSLISVTSCKRRAKHTRKAVGPKIVSTTPSISGNGDEPYGLAPNYHPHRCTVKLWDQPPTRPPILLQCSQTNPPKWSHCLADAIKWDVPMSMGYYGMSGVVEPRKKTMSSHLVNSSAESR